MSSVSANTETLSLIHPAVSHISQYGDAASPVRDMDARAGDAYL